MLVLLILRLAPKNLAETISQSTMTPLSQVLDWKGVGGHFFFKPYVECDVRLSVPRVSNICGYGLATFPTILKMRLTISNSS